MKRWASTFLVLSVFLVLNIAFSAAQSNEIILKISGNTNAHGELHNGAGNYQTLINFSQFFPGETIPGSRVCTGENTVIRLSGTTNAHAESPTKTTSGYQNVCYGSLSCALKSSCDISNGEVKILGLSSSTNAHLETASQNNYANYLCCTLGDVIPGDIEVTSAQWRNPANQQISTSYIGRTVKLYAEVENGEGRVIQFDAWEDDPLGDDDIPLAQNNATVQNGIAEINLQITQSLVDSLNDGNDCDNGLEFFFKAGDLESQKLTVICEQGPNQPPIAEISSVVHRQIYFANTQIAFNQTSYDPEGDSLEYNWEILNSQGQTEHETTQRSFNFNFSQAGERIITLTVSDGEFEVSDRVAILIVASPGIFAYINKPEYHSVVENIQGNKRVDFSGTDSYVINILGSSCSNLSGQCLGGFCPNKVSNSPAGCSSNITISNAPQTPENADYSQIEFSWEFSDNNQLISIPPEKGRTEGWVGFNKKSNNLNDKTGTLSLNYGSGNSTLQQSVQTEFTLGRCLDNGKLYLWEDGRTESTSNPNVCQGTDGVLFSQGGQVPDCCPANQFCVSGGGNYNCQVAPINSCADYDNEDDCDDDIYDIADDDPAGNNLTCSSNQQLTGVKCSWNDNTDSCGIKAVCGLNSGTSGETQCEQLSCEYTYTQSSCSNGLMDITYVLAPYQQPPNACPGYPSQPEYQQLCAKDPVTVPCGRLTFELGFFDYTNLIISSLIIALTYLILIYSRKNEN